MLFDDLVKTVEQHIPQHHHKLKPALDHCAIFDFGSSSLEEQPPLYFPRHLPFPQVYIEMHIKHNEVNGGKADAGDRIGFLIFEAGTKKGSLTYNTLLYTIIDNQSPFILIGDLTQGETDSPLHTYHSAFSSLTGFKEVPYSDVLDSNIGVMCRFFLSLNLSYLNRIMDHTSGEFIIEETPVRMKPNNSPKKISRSYQKPRYTLLHFKEANKRYGLGRATGTGAKKSPHPVRGHYRTFRSDRYVNKQGEKIWVPHYWVGPERVQVGNKIYKVILEV